MSTALQSFFLRWLPMGIIVVTEMVVLIPLRDHVFSETTWGPFAALAAFGLSILLLIDWKNLPDFWLPNPNGRTIPQYLFDLLYFAVAIAPIIFTPTRR